MEKLKLTEEQINAIKIVGDIKCDGATCYNCPLLRFTQCLPQLARVVKRGMTNEKE